MNRALSDPNNPSPKVSPDDCWDDAEILEVSGKPAPTVLPPRRTATEPTSSGPAASTENGSPGLWIESNLVRREDSDADQQLEVQEIRADVVRLEQPEPAPPKVARHTRFHKKEPVEPSPLSPRGEGHEWGLSKRQSILWILGIGGGVIAVVIVAMMLLPGINKANAAREVPSDRSLKVIEEEVVEGIDALNLMFEKQPEAELIFRAYSRATVADDVLPLVRDGERLKELIRENWKPMSIPDGWSPPEDFVWQVAKSGNHSCGILEGTLPDFSKFSTYFVNHDNRLLLDWKATTGYSTATYEQMAQGTGNTLEIRGTLIPSTFYTSTWQEIDHLSYQLVSPAGEVAIWCYARRGDPATREILRLFQSGEILRETEAPKKVTLRLERGPEGSLPNQWLITEMLHSDWITP